MIPERRRLQAEVDVEHPEVPVARADVIEAHFVNDLLERVDLMRHEGDAPFPVVDAGGTGDELGDATGVFAADPRVPAGSG